MLYAVVGYGRKKEEMRGLCELLGALLMNHCLLNADFICFTPFGGLNAMLKMIPRTGGGSINSIYDALSSAFEVYIGRIRTN